MKSLKLFFLKYQAYVQALLIPLGPWGVLTIALIDSAALGIPLDPVVAIFVHRDPHRSLLYAIMGAAGSAIGSLVPYFIGYKGGEALVVKRIGQAKFNRIHGMSEKYGDLALIVPGMLPPPTPFKLFVFSAGVAEMNWMHFLLAVFTGRILRFAALSALTIQFGPEIVQITQALVKQHKGAVLISLALITIAVLLLTIVKKRKEKPEVAMV